MHAARCTAARGTRQAAGEQTGPDAGDKALPHVVAELASFVQSMIERCHQYAI